ncbi:MAG: tol-pal system protein YbgF [Vicinamibacterales bacterium]|nr:tol-pal system protein YbgF [Vicinamibacterales bacterium]
MRGRLLRAWCAAVLVAGLGVAPLLAADREHQQIVADIRMLQEQTQQIALAIASLADALKAAMTRLEQRLDQQTEVTRKGFADQKLQLDSMGSDLKVIRERSDETNVRISALDQEIEALRAAIPPQGFAPPPDPSATVPDGQPAPAPPPAPAPSAAGLSPRRMLEQSFADYTAGQYTLAIQGYEAFLRTFPTSDQADDAQFMIGESHFSARKDAEAVTAYNEVITRYPGGNATPDAYYKRGLVMERMGNADGARESWQQVTKVFPETDAGRLAKQGLDRLAARKP